jgi:UDP-N-acetylmuramoyl-L-alanyl-D-glutamate--2,6-diaminopimelate ligase
MRLKKLLAAYIEINAAHDCEVNDLTLNTQQAQIGNLFFAVPGAQSDGRAYLLQAARQKVCAIVCEAQGIEAFLPQIKRCPCPVYAIDDLSNKLGHLASQFYGTLASPLSVIGVTGTNGKTTCAHLLAQALHHLGQPCGIIGTLGYGLYPKPWFKGNLTTPNPIALHQQLAQLKALGAQTVVMEVSSHALSQQRVAGMVFDSALFTNLSEEHLDYHGTVANYRQAKQQLFAWPTLKRAVLNADDPMAGRYAQVLCHKATPIFYTTQSTLARQFAAYAHLQVKQASFNDGLLAELHSSWGKGTLRSKLMGAFNLQNLLCVLAELCGQGYPWFKAIAALAKAHAPTGRMQKLGGGKMPIIIIDYAHTPDALAQALIAARQMTQRRLWCVFGCGGDRDRGKRALMGEVAMQYADQVVITQDNPRHEPPQQIMAQIIQGISTQDHSRLHLELNRMQAINYAVNRALVYDVVLIAGKGHENYQLVGNQSLPFSDIGHVKKLLGNVAHEFSNHRRAAPSATLGGQSVDSSDFH